MSSAWASIVKCTLNGFSPVIALVTLKTCTVLPVGHVTVPSIGGKGAPTADFMALTSLLMVVMSVQLMRSVLALIASSLVPIVVNQLLTKV